MSKRGEFSAGPGKGARGLDKAGKIGYACFNGLKAKITGRLPILWERNESAMPITDLLERNSKLFGNEVALVEINPEVQEKQRVTWKEYALIQPTSAASYRREITWSVFDEKANRVANLLLGRGIRKGQKVAILLMNCLEWLPIYFGILKTGAVAVPLNFRYTASEIEYCLKLADVDVLFFGPEFIGRIEDIVDSVGQERLLFFVGDSCRSFAEDYHRAAANCSSAAPKVLLDDDDEAAIYFSSGTTGFPKEKFFAGSENFYIFAV